ncbi:histidine kinase [Streptomyces kunmingensis]|uniref:histidine kinase n=1 Tax=Streptomyces kunmingensis TaxID=68225 RepID=A0ABU6CJH2_9ACTN|nr:histidine kinase [Streptomyces kunmingensis]MEB3964530.1 histidine kinase [Streptomyces kunmingensis]
MFLPRGLLRAGGPPDPGRVLRQDAVLAAAMAAVAVCLALRLHGEGRQLTVLGWVLLLAAHVPAVWRRRAPLVSFLGVVACVGPYHALNFDHAAPQVVSLTALFTVAMTGRPLRSLIIGAGVIGLMLSVKFGQNMAEGQQALRISGWIVTVVLLGVYARLHRQYVDSVVERAERAERTREEEARRRVAEERLRVARDLHDLLAHSITLVGVQTSVAAHVLNADPDRLDRAAVAKALDDIADTCRSARGELRATLEVLRSMPDEARGALPGLDGIPELVRAARTAGASVLADLDVDGGLVPAGVGAAAYRIVQEALTNAVRHGGAGLTIRVGVRVGAGALVVSVCDDGVGMVASGVPGFGLVGMRERVRSVGGVLDVGSGEAGGFVVTASLPLPGAPVTPRGSAPVPAPQSPEGLELAAPGASVAPGGSAPVPAPQSPEGLELTAPGDGVVTRNVVAAPRRGATR